MSPEWGDCPWLDAYHVLTVATEVGGDTWWSVSGPAPFRGDGSEYHDTVTHVVESAAWAEREAARADHPQVTAAIGGAVAAIDRVLVLRVDLWDQLNEDLVCEEVTGIGQATGEAEWLAARAGGGRWD